MSKLIVGEDDSISQLYYDDKIIKTFLMVLDSILRTNNYGFTRINGKLIKITLEVDGNEKH
jgi:NAD-specific glutamate dehydrogenase